MSYFKLFGVAVLRAWEYGVAHGLGIFLAAFFFIIVIYRRYHRLLQKDRAAKALHRTNVFVVVDGDGSHTDDINNSSLMKSLEEESDDDVDDIDYAKLLRELDTPANLRKQLAADEEEQNQKKEESHDEEQQQQDSESNNNKNNHLRTLPPASTTRSRPFALRLMDAIEHTAVTQLAELVRLHSSLHRQDNANRTQFMDQTAVFDIPENVARNRAVSILEGALRQRRREAAMLMSTTGTNQDNQHQRKDLEDEIYHSLFDNHCTSSIPSPASILSSNRHNNLLVGTAKSNAPFMRQREAYYTTCIDSALSIEDSTFNFATHFAYGTDVGGIAKPTTGRLMANFFLGADRFAKSNLRGGHVITAGGLLATMPDPLVCRRDLLLNEKQKTASASASSQTQNHHNNKTAEERAEAQSAFRELSDDWTKGATWSISSGNELDLLRRYDELVVLCVRSAATTMAKNKTASNNNSSTGSDWSLPSCVPLFSSVHNIRNKQPRVITCTTPHALKYLLPEYASPRDSTVSTQRRYRYHLENVAAIRKALEKHAEDIAIEGFAVGERVLFKRSVINKIKESIADGVFGVGKYFKLIGGVNSNAQSGGGLFGSGNKNRNSNKNNNSSRNSQNDEEMERLVNDDKKHA